MVMMLLPSVPRWSSTTGYSPEGTHTSLTTNLNSDVPIGRRTWLGGEEREEREEKEEEEEQTKMKE